MRTHPLFASVPKPRIYTRAFILDMVQQLCPAFSSLGKWRRLARVVPNDWLRNAQGPDSGAISIERSNITIDRIKNKSSHPHFKGYPGDVCAHTYRDRIVFNYFWLRKDPTVAEVAHVLHHEMVHYYMYSIPQLENFEPPHGKVFQAIAIDTGLPLSDDELKRFEITNRADIAYRCILDENRDALEPYFWLWFAYREHEATLDETYKQMMDLPDPMPYWRRLVRPLAASRDHYQDI